MDFYQILNENMRNYRPEDDIEYPHAWGSKEFNASLVLKNGVLHDPKKNADLAIPSQIFQGIVGEPNDTYTLEATVTVSGHYVPGYDKDKMIGDAEIEAENAILVNDRTREEAILPDELATRLFGTQPGSPYQVDYEDEVRGGKVDLSVR